MTREYEAELRRRAERATDGPWRTATNRPRGPWADGDTVVTAADGVQVLSRNWKQVCLNAIYIAVALPDVILELLDELTRLRAQDVNRQEAINKAAGLIDDGEAKAAFDMLVGALGNRV